MRPDLVTKILLRALGYDRNFNQRVGDEVRLDVLYDDTSSEHTDVLKAFQELSSHRFRGLPIKVDEFKVNSEASLRQHVEEDAVDIVYICSGLSNRLPAILAVAEAKKVVTIATGDAYRHSGIAIGVSQKGDLPRLWINFTASRAEGMDVSADLMRIADPVS